MIILPRQARDKHRESTQKSAVFLQKNGSGGGILQQLDDDGLATLKAALLGGDGSGLELLEVWKHPLMFGATLRFLTQTDHFAKTGSGQT